MCTKYFAGLRCIVSLCNSLGLSQACFLKKTELTGRKEKSTKRRVDGSAGCMLSIVQSKKKLRRYAFERLVLTVARKFLVDNSQSDAVFSAYRRHGRLPSFDMLQLILGLGG